ncbi:MAG: hypothetical protein ABI867_05130 [Kofleriaceae bacterium]
MKRALVMVALLAPRVALAQEPPLAQIKDDKQLSEALAQITNDPAIPVEDPKLRPLAQALMIEGVRQLQNKIYDQALANFLEAYAKFPSPKILLNVASTLRDMGRGADAANTYQRYLSDPQSGSERIAEVKELLIRLDEQLTILTVRVFPHGSDISIDAGPFIPVGSTLVTRVRPGIHLVRIRNDNQTNEVSVNGFEGENKEVAAALTIAVPVMPPVTATKPTAPPDNQNGWLITGQYKSDGTGNQRGVLKTTAGESVSAITPVFDIMGDGDVVVRSPTHDTISSGLLGVVRIDAEGRGFAGGLGLAIARGRFEGDVMVLRSNVTGGYLGFRYRFLVGFLRPYAALGIPGFVFDNTVQGAMGETTTETKLAIGARVAGGIELYINGHLSVQGDIGFEHFWFVKDTRFVENVWVPTLGVIGRL